MNKDAAYYTGFEDGFADNGGVYADGVLTWNLTDVAPDATVTVTFDVVVSAANVVIENMATVLEGVNSYETNIVTNSVPEEPTTSTTTTIMGGTTTVPTSPTTVPSFPDAPQTGDTADRFGWLALLLGGLTAMLTTIFVGKKKTE